jgi:hypothetical protein
MLYLFLPSRPAMTMPGNGVCGTTANPALTLQPGGEEDGGVLNDRATDG